MAAEQPPAYNVTYHLARFHRVGRRYGRAIRLHQDALAERERTLGPDHPETLRSCTGLANSFYAAGHYPEAIELFQETLARRARTLGPEHPDTLRSRGSRQLLPRHRRLRPSRPDAPGHPGRPGAGAGR